MANKNQHRWRLKMLGFHGGMLLAPLMVLYAETTLKIEALGHCLFKNLVGFEGPACGITHAARAVLNGQLESSIQFHPAGPAIMAMLAGMTVYLAVVTTSGWRGWTWAREVKVYKTLEIVVVALLLLGWAAKHFIP